MMLQMITSTPVLQNLILEMNTSWETWFIYRSPYQGPREGYKISMSQCNRYGNKTRLQLIFYIYVKIMLDSYTMDADSIHVIISL